MENSNNKNDISPNLNYLQKKVYSLLLECLNSYSLFEKQQPLATAQLANMFMNFRDTVTNSVNITDRFKSFSSFKKNIEKEITKALMISDISDSSSTEEIDNFAKNIVQNIVKDFFGATFVMFTDTDLTYFMEFNKDPYINKLYRQSEIIYYYLTTDNPNNVTINLSSNISDLIDISDTFIEDISDDDIPISTMIPPLNTTNIPNKSVYYSQLISLLTLLRNVSMPINEKSKDYNFESKYCCSEIDVPYIFLFEEFQDETKGQFLSNDKSIEILNQKAKQAYHTPKPPFDIQLKQAVEEEELIRTNPAIAYKALSTKERNKCVRHLLHLKENLRKARNDRFHNQILFELLPSILEVKPSENNPLCVKIENKKHRVKSNGFVANYYTVNINDLITYELQTTTEFRKNLANEVAAHNVVLDNKSFNIFPLFKLKNPTDNMQENKERLNLYCTFLNDINIDDLGTSKENNASKQELQKIIDYAISQIEVCEKIRYKQNDELSSLDFYSYLTNYIIYSGAEFGSISPAHRIKSNQAMVIPQNMMYALEDLLKSRRGLTYLANLIRIKYKSESIKRNDGILSLNHFYKLKHDKIPSPEQYNPQFFSLELMGEYDIPSKLEIASSTKSEHETTYPPFFPQGQHHLNSELDER